jgi:hypothetical protein
MKTKITLLVMEVYDRPRVNGVVPLRMLVNEDYEPISKYISTKSEMDTITELLLKYSNLEVVYCYPHLADFFHEKGSSECEVIYTISMPEHLIRVKNEGILVDIEEVNLKERYVRSIERTPRSIVREY